MTQPNVHLQVQPRYLPQRSSPLQEVYGFAYTITIANHGTESVQLISRHWLIVDADGVEQEVKGLGVVGQQPLLLPGQAFEYTSGCQLHTPTGSMQGTFHFVHEDGSRFAVPVPRFILDATGHSGPRVLH